MTFITGIDPGRDGGIVTLDPDGEIFFSSVLPYKDSQTDHVELARIYSELNNHISTWHKERQLNCGIHRIVLEKIFTRPSDNGSEEYLKALEAVCVALSGVLSNPLNVVADNDEHALTITRDSLLRLQDGLAHARKFYTVRDRRDGRVGVLNYAKSAGILFMGAAFGWEYHEVSPKTWGAEMKRGLTGESKEKSIEAVRRIDERLLEQPSPLFKSSRARVVHMGLLEAYLMACWGRRDLGLDLVEDVG